MLHAMIMAGGGGTRFWPRSRKARPKQFLTFGSERTLLQQAFDRVEGLANGQIHVITGADYCEETARQLPSVKANFIVGEPEGRDTAPCIGLGAALIAKENPNAIMMVLPADHVIEPEREFQRATQVAMQLIEANPQALVTFGIPPTFASTGYGYIHRGEPLEQLQGISTYRVQRFREKPKQEKANEYFASGEYYWNGGIFVWKVKAILEQLNKQKPELYKGVQRIAESWDKPNRQQVLETEFPKLEKISIDFAVMEKAPEVLAIHAPFQWDDVGSWLALERRFPQDENGNTVEGNHVGIRTKNCVIASEGSQLLTTIGVENLLIIQDGDAILIADRRDEGSVKELVELLKKRGLEKYL